VVDLRARKVRVLREVIQGRQIDAVPAGLDILVARVKLKAVLVKVLRVQLDGTRAVMN
jgi:hypothetical protein